MRRWIWVCAGVAVAAVLYWAWPLVGAAQLAQAARQGDTAGVASRVDIPALRRSLARQIGFAYLRATGKADKLGTFGRSVAGAAVTTVADSYVADLLTPDNITALLGQGKISQVKVGDKSVVVDRQLSGFASGDMMSVLTGSYFDGLTSFVISVKAGEDQTYAVHLHLRGLAWLLSGIDLPPAMVDDMAKSILAGQKPGT